MRITAAFDPVTRIEGHLNITISIDRVNGVQQVVDVKATGGLFRGFEKQLIGRDPRDAQHITERICGVCPVAHGMAAVKNLDGAFGVSAPDNGRIMRNLVNGSNFVESHILHFYLLSVPDFIEGPAMPPWQADWKVDRRLDKTASGSLLNHYIQALTMRRKADQMTALFGGKVPHPPAYIVGGFTCTPRQERIDQFNAFLDELIPFIRDVYIPDVEILAAHYEDYYTIGRGYGNLLAFGVFELDAAGTNRLLARGHAVNGSRTIQPLDVGLITEHVSHSWFQNGTEANPSAGKTIPENPKNGAYSWLKAPRYQQLPYEVGPLARMWINGDYQNGISVMDRHLSRAREALKVAEAMRTWVNQLDPAGPVYNPSSVPQTADSYGLTEAPRGALGHWLEITGGKLSRYQVISPTTWNCSPRDDAGKLGPIEQALLGTAVENSDQPIEVMRIIHSFDPCLDCATHIIRPGQKAKLIHLGM
ncbi:MAG TPA: nickel-dependent hydrogenase large subunit [Anaerohalosphaeraceae bacterium]|nr:nickel-dependent hydrogenase large subunit [Anaerohalosphaeraceae bacterium]